MVSRKIKKMCSCIDIYNNGIAITGCPKKIDNNVRQNFELI